MVKVHRITGRHVEEVKLTAYVRRLDKIYADQNKSAMLPKVVKKMRTMYADNPHSFYLLVCGKYGIKPQKEVDAYAIVYGKTMFDRVKAAEDEEAELEAARLAKEIVESKDPIEEDMDEDDSGFESDSRSTSKSASKSDLKEKESEMWPSKNKYSRPTMKIDIPNRSSNRYNYQMPERRRTSPRMEYGLNSPRAHYQYKRHQKAPVDQLDYVDVHPGDIVETMVLTGKVGDDQTGFWIPARILSIDEKNQTMELQVLNPRKYGLAARAVKVPLKYVRSPASIQYN